MISVTRKDSIGHRCFPYFPVSYPASDFLSFSSAETHFWISISAVTIVLSRPISFGAAIDAQWWDILSLRAIWEECMIFHAQTKAGHHLGQPSSKFSLKHINHSFWRSENGGGLLASISQESRWTSLCSHPLITFSHRDRTVYKSMMLLLWMNSFQLN